ncbi:MAG: AbgT family transporter [Bacteroidales bacterium]|nr:AbgT family transporter [Bacteroidales bacterium]
MHQRKREIPHTFVIIFLILIASAILTWLIPSGEFDRTVKILEDGSQREIVVPGSFHYVEKSPQTWQILSSFFEGFVQRADIIVFILLIGGAFWVLNASKAIDAGIVAFLKVAQRLERFKLLQKIGIHNIIMLLIMTVFSIFGSVFGMSEETIAFIIIVIPLAISMGYDSITGLCLVYVSAHVGFSGAMLNPFTIGIAQGLSDLPIFSGLEYRFLCWILLNIIAFTFILLWAKKVKKNPKISPMYELDDYWRKNHNFHDTQFKYYTPKSAWISYGLIITILIVFSVLYPMSVLKIGNGSFHFPAVPIGSALFAIFGFLGLRKSVHFYILSILGITIWFLISGVMGYGWYVMEIGTLFFGMGLAAGMAADNSANQIVKLFVEGMKDIFTAAIVVGLAGGVIVILQEGKIIDTIMFGLSQSMNEMGKVGSTAVIYVIQNGLNIIIPSGSAKAALTMPIMAPFADMIEISRQTNVLAFQFGDGFTNMITPTSGVLIGCLGVARIPYDKWFRWIWKFILLLILVGFLLLLPTLFFPINGF